jgi:hypothetical protein
VARTSGAAGLAGREVASDLVATGRRFGRRRERRVGEVRYRIPVEFAEATAAPQEARERHVELAFAFEIRCDRKDCVPVAAFLRVAFDDGRVRATDAPVDHGESPRRGTVSGHGGSTISWLFGDLDARSAVVAGHVVSVHVEVPARLPRLSGALRAEATARRRLPVPFRPRRVHARDVRPRRFSLLLVASPGPAAEAAAGGVAPPPELLRPAVRMCVAVDVERFSRFRNPEATRAKQRLVEVLAAARRQTDVAEAAVHLRESGDGEFAVFPAGIDESSVIPDFVDGLVAALRAANADLSEHARLRLRVALHRGHVEPTPHGWVGDATIGVHRLLDSHPVREALRGHPRVDAAFVVADTLYQDVVAHAYEQLRPELFQEVVVDLPEKGFRERAWLYLPKQ